MNAQGRNLEDQIEPIALLAEPARRALYRYVVSRSGDVSRDEAAQACGVSRALAAFHLDKLVEEGLLDVTFRRLSGRTGPGAGRPSKLYRRSARELSVSIPPRSYELAAKLFARALDSVDTEDTGFVLGDVAWEFGESVGDEARRLAGEGADGEHLLAATEAVLAAYGYEPFRDERQDICLRNCPFHALASEHRQLVCGMNLRLMDGVIEGAGMTDISASLEPRPDRCCVAFRHGEDSA